MAGSFAEDLVKCLQNGLNFEAGLVVAQTTWCIISITQKINVTQQYTEKKHVTGIPSPPR